jgi:peptidoglycan/xylan/chitin deacetylase (PgdA/CDA1 family)
LRRLAKSAIEFALTALRITDLVRARRTADVLVLSYHNIVPDGARSSGDASLHLPQRTFAQQLDLLTRTHDVVAITDLPSVRRTKPRVVITFDDAYAGAMEAGLAELNKRSLPATVFVTPGFVGGRPFWWDRLAGSSGLDARTREYALNELGGRNDAILAWAESSGMPLTDPPAYQAACSESALESAAQAGLFTFGAHTWTHPNLARLTPAELDDELRRPLAWLRARFGNTAPLLAYPYGLRTKAVAEAARSAGYERAFLIEGGWMKSAATMATSSFEVPRWNVPAGISRRGFEIRTSGVW